MQNINNLIKSIILGLVFVVLFLITYYSIYNFEIGMWVKYFGLEFKNVLLPSMLFFFSGFFMFRIFNSWRNNKIKRIYLLTYLIIIILLLLSLFGDYAMRDCSLIQKCDSPSLCVPQGIECDAFIFSISLFALLSPIMILISLINWIIQKRKAKQ